MSDLDATEVAVYQIFTLAYRQGMTVKEYRQSIMEVTRQHEDATIRRAMMPIIQHMSSERLAGVMASAARVKAEVTRRMLMMLPDDEPGA